MNRTNQREGLEQRQRNGAGRLYAQQHANAVPSVKKTGVSGDALTGAAFTIVNTTDSAESYTLTGSAITSDWAQYGLTPDTFYLLTETVTLAGYMTAAPVTFKISSANGQVYVSTDGYAGRRITASISQRTDRPEMSSSAQTSEPLRRQSLAARMRDSFVTAAKLALYAADGVIAADRNRQHAGRYVKRIGLHQAGHGAELHPQGTGHAWVVTERLCRSRSPWARTPAAIYVLTDSPFNTRFVQRKKTWASGSSPVAVTFDLQDRRSHAVESIVLTADDSDGKIAFAGTAAICVDGKYPTADRIGAAITYTVVERPIFGYVTSPMAYRC